MNPEVAQAVRARARGGAWISVQVGGLLGDDRLHVFSAPSSVGTAMLFELVAKWLRAVAEGAQVEEWSKLVEAHARRSAAVVVAVDTLENSPLPDELDRYQSFSERAVKDPGLVDMLADGVMESTSLSRYEAISAVSAVITELGGWGMVK